MPPSLLLRGLHEVHIWYKCDSGNPTVLKMAYAQCTSSQHGCTSIVHSTPRMGTAASHRNSNPDGHGLPLRHSECISLSHPWLLLS